MNYIVGAIYRHHGSKVPHFVSELEACLNKLPCDSLRILAGDMNINLKNINHNDTFDYFTTLSAKDFYPYICSPTRITDNTATLIDHIFLRYPRRFLNPDISSGNIVSDVTDHMPNFLIIERKK